jgi:hypothetical protein
MILMSESKITTLDYQNRERKKIEDRQAQKSQMDARRLMNGDGNYQKAVAASQDREYMTAALEKVRQSDISHHEDLTRMNGNWIQNQSMKR